MSLRPFSLRQFAIAVVLLGTAAYANANLTVYTSKTAFTAALNQSGVDSFNGRLEGDQGSVLSGTAGTLTYKASTASSIFIVANPAGAGDLWLSTAQDGAIITLNTFSPGVNAIGGLFFASDDFGSIANQPLVVTALDGNSTSAQTLPSTSASSFLGFISTNTLVSLTLRPTAPINGGIYATVNDLQLGVAAPVPEPETYALMLAGLGLIGWRASRRAAR